MLRIASSAAHVRLAYSADLPALFFFFFHDPDVTLALLRLAPKSPKYLFLQESSAEVETIDDSFDGSILL